MDIELNIKIEIELPEYGKKIPAGCRNKVPAESDAVEFQVQSYVFKWLEQLKDRGVYDEIVKLTKTQAALPPDSIQIRGDGQ